MRQSETIAALAVALAKVQGEVSNVIADTPGQIGHQKYKYATLGQMWDMARPILAKHELAVVQGPIIEGDLYALKTLLLHKSGEWLETAIYPLQIDVPQHMGKAITYGRRYSLAPLLGIAAEEDTDASGVELVKNNVTRLGPTDIPKEEGDPSAAKSKKAWGVLFDAMKRQKSTAELNRWWAASEKEIRQMNAQFRWDFFKETIYQGLRLAQKKLEIDLFWSFHEDRFARLKKQDIVRYEELEEAMLNKVDKLEQLVEG